MATKDDVVKCDDMARWCGDHDDIAKLEWAIEMCLGEQANYDHMDCKSKSKHNLYLVRRSNLGCDYLKDNISLGK